MIEFLSVMQFRLFDNTTEDNLVATDTKAKEAENKAGTQNVKTQNVETQNVSVTEEQDPKQVAKDNPEVETTDEGVPTGNSVSGVDGFAGSAQASTGEVVDVPKSPEEIAEQGTQLGLDGDFSTGGNPVGDPERESGDAPVYARVWGMDTDHTTNNRYQPDALKPDCSVRVQ